MQIWAIALGGALGAVTRYASVTAVHTVVGRGFPWGTLTVNVVGSLLAGLLFTLFAERWNVGPELRGLVLVGFLGAFTTFSAFSMENLGMLLEGQLLRFLLNAMGSVLICLLAAWVGMLLARHVVA
jgi:CrcB protein